MYKAKITCTFVQVLVLFAVILSGTAVAQEAPQVQLSVQFVELARNELETGFGWNFQREVGEPLDCDQPVRGYFPIELDARYDGETEHVWRWPATTLQTDDNLTSEFMDAVIRREHAASTLAAPRILPLEMNQDVGIIPRVSNYQLDIPNLPVDYVISVEVCKFPRFENCGNRE